MHINNFQCGADYSLPLHLYGQEKIERDYVGSIFLSSDIHTQHVIIQNWHEMQRRGGEKTERGTVETSKTDGNVLCGPHVQPAVIPCKALLPSLTCHTFACAVPPVGWRLRDIRPSYAHARGEDGKRVRGIQRVHSVRLSKRKKNCTFILGNGAFYHPDPRRLRVARLSGRYDLLYRLHALEEGGDQDGRVEDGG